ncbi:hypothetical protein JCM16303_000357 [Sporobolomyces ruberrimus]
MPRARGNAAGKKPQLEVEARRHQQEKEIGSVSESSAEDTSSDDEVHSVHSGEEHDGSEGREPRRTRYKTADAKAKHAREQQEYMERLKRKRKEVPASGESSKAQALKVELAEKQESRDSTLTKYSYPAGRPNATDADRQAWEAIQTKEAAERARHNLKSSQSAAKKKAQGKLRAGSPGWQSKEAVKKAKRALSSRVSYHKQADREKLQKKLEAPGILDEDAEGDSDYDVEPQVSSSLGRAPLNRRQALLYSQTHTRPRSLF